MSPTQAPPAYINMEPSHLCIRGSFLFLIRKGDNLSEMEPVYDTRALNEQSFHYCKYSLFSTYTENESSLDFKLKSSTFLRILEFEVQS